MDSPHKDQWYGALMFFFDLCLNKQLSKQPRSWWVEMPSPSLRRHCNDIPFSSRWLHCFTNVFDIWSFMKPWCCSSFHHHYHGCFLLNISYFSTKPKNLLASCYRWYLYIYIYIYQWSLSCWGKYDGLFWINFAASIFLFAILPFRVFKCITTGIYLWNFATKIH